MGIRGRSGEKKVKQMRVAKASMERRKFLETYEMTRAQAERALSNGADPTDKVFVNHPNYHVRKKAFVLAGSNWPTNDKDRAALAVDLHIKEKVLVASPIMCEC